MQSHLKSLHKNGVANLSAHKGWKGWEKFFRGGFNRADVTYSKKGFKAQFWLPKGKRDSLLRLRVYPKTSLHFCTSNNHVDFKCISGQVLMNTSYGRHAQQENDSVWQWVFKRLQVLGTMLRSWCSHEMTQLKIDSIKNGDFRAWSSTLALRNKNGNIYIFIFFICFFIFQ